LGVWHQKFSKDLTTAFANYEPVQLAEYAKKNQSSGMEDFMVFPIEIKLAKKQKLTLFFTK